MLTVRRLAAAMVAALLLSLLGPVATANAVPEVNPTPIFRFYKTTDGSHFFTSNEGEKGALEAQGGAYRYEGVAFYSYPAEVAATSPVYRFYNFRQGVHFYTSNPVEYENLLGPGKTTFKYEGIAYYADQVPVANSAPVYRFYKFRQGVHFYTSNQAEATYLNDNASPTYRFEGTSYNVPTLLRFSGTGSGRTESFILPTTLAVFRSSNSGSTGMNADLVVASTGEIFDYVATDDAGETSSSAVGAGENRYILTVETDGPWSITVEQPKASAGYIADFAESGDRASTVFSLEAGPKTISYTATDGGSFYLYMYDATGQIVAAIEDGLSPGYGSTYEYIDRGNHLFMVLASGPWTVSIH